MVGEGDRVEIRFVTGQRLTGVLNEPLENVRLALDHALSPGRFRQSRAFSVFVDGGTRYILNARHILWIRPVSASQPKETPNA